MSTVYKVQVHVKGGWATTLLTARWDIAIRKFRRTGGHRRFTQMDSYGVEQVMFERGEVIK